MLHNVLVINCRWTPALKFLCQCTLTKLEMFVPIVVLGHYLENKLLLKNLHTPMTPALSESDIENVKIITITDILLGPKIILLKLWDGAYILKMRRDLISIMFVAARTTFS